MGTSNSLDGEALLAAGGIIAETREFIEEYVKAEAIEIVEPGTGVTALAVRRGNDVSVLPASSFDSYRLAPRFRHGTATMLSLDSFIDHTNRFKDPNSAVFANDDRDAPSLTSVLDYHFAGGIHDVPPRFGKHRASFGFPLSDEWKAWNKADATPMDMADFAAFLENRIIDVLYLIPSEDSLPEDMQRLVDTLGGGTAIATPNKLMELARGLQVNENSVVREAVNLATGEGVVHFQTEHTDANGAPLKVPSVFLIAIPVFRNGPLYRLLARLRYRKAPGGGLKFWYELWRIDRTFDHAFTEAVERVRVETELPVLIGKPEA